MAAPRAVLSFGPQAASSLFSRPEIGHRCAPCIRQIIQQGARFVEPKERYRDIKNCPSRPSTLLLGAVSALAVQVGAS
jgi:hypothetical protein